MGAHYDRVSSHTQDEVRGTRLIPVQTIVFTTKPNGIYLEHRIDLSQVDVTAIDPIIDILAQNVEILAQRADVAAVSYLQDVTTAGFLIDVIEVIVSSTSGASTMRVAYPLEDVVSLAAGTSTGLKNPLTGKAEVPIPAIVAELDAIEALGGTPA